MERTINVPPHADTTYTTGRDLEHCQRTASKILATRGARYSSYDRM